MTESTPQPGGALVDNPWGRPLGVLVSPNPTFDALRRQPTWVPAAIVLMVLYLAIQALVFQRMDMESAVREQLSSRGGEMSEEQIDQAVAIQSKVGLGCAVVTFPLGIAAMAGLFLGLIHLAGGEIGFRRSLAVSLHGLMPQSVASLLAIPLVLGREEISVEEASQGRILASHLGAFAPADVSPVVAALLGRIDVFSLWAILLLIIGFHRVAGISKGAATGIVLALWLVWVGLAVGGAALGAFGGG